ncbi:NAD-dependent epimerase/dehydratase family protein [Phenylobacterium sp. J426]|uniref:NAD-dependent epimerase/dehydratase family protein n=1 Tax=Phenylobacterium sp. J426 TaxID=2898439 RepID=UPI002150E674|nr:NAD-dependent epimerase/dehydratase family protein [Phenylobacterium sp. J426]MCR5873380.1 NAD-dependent epimerase/dehydratase family protein [Phenylobacterium sp. J426]
MTTVLLTGASSFTGLWMADALAGEGWHVVAPVLRARGDYAGIRAERVRTLEDVAEVVFEAPVGSPAFLDLVGAKRPDLLAHHAADIPGYRLPDYDVEAGVARNMAGIPETIAAFASAGGRAVLATGTYFEAGEGGGDEAASPYGLSKSLTNAAQRDLARNAGLAFGKFVIPAPFGPWEEGRLVWSLFQAWTQGRAAEIRTPEYVRDHLPAPYLALAYAWAAARLREDGGEQTFRPSGYVERVGDFATRVAGEVRARTAMACDLVEHVQTAFPEPRRRANAEPLLDDAEEAPFWDIYVDYYDQVQTSGLLQATAA